MIIEIDPLTKELLKKLGFEEVEGKAKLYTKHIDNDTDAYVDFRKQNGRRFANRNGVFVDDEDSIEILKQFKEERDKLKSSNDIFERQNNNIASDTLQSSSKDVVQSHETKRTLDNDMEPETISTKESPIHTPQDVKSVPAL